MKQFLSHRSRRFGYDGWALRSKSDGWVVQWSVCTTRQECRELKKERHDLFNDDWEIVKVKIGEVVPV